MAAPKKAAATATQADAVAEKTETSTDETQTQEQTTQADAVADDLVELKGGNVTFEGVEYESVDGVVKVPAQAVALLVESFGYEA